MYLMSSRKNFSNPYVFSTQPQIGRLSYNGHVSRVSKTSFEKNINNKKILVILLGFNKTYDYVVEEYKKVYKKIRTDLSGEYGEIVGYLWPVECPKKDCFDLNMHRNMRYAGELFRNWTNLFLNARNTVDIIGHGMGLGVGYVALQGIQPFHIRNVFALGPAILTTWFHKEKMRHMMLSNADQFYLFHSLDDPILQCGFQMRTGEKTLGYSGAPDREQFLEKFTRVSIVDCSEVILNHPGYLKTPAIFHFIGDLLREKEFDRIIKFKNYANSIELPKTPELPNRQATFDFDFNT